MKVHLSVREVVSLSALLLSGVFSSSQVPPNNHDHLSAAPEPVERFEFVAETPFKVAERGAFHRLWKKTVRLANTVTGEEREEERSFVELSDGMHYWDGEWKESQELIEPLDTGEAVAIRGQHKVIFSPNINTEGSFDLLTVDAKRLRGHVVGFVHHRSAHRKLSAGGHSEG